MRIRDLYIGTLNEIEKEYTNFAQQIYYDEEFIDHKELEPFRKNIKVLFKELDIKSLMEGESREWFDILDNITFLAEQLGDRDIEIPVIRHLRFNLDPTIEKLFGMLYVLYCPEYISKRCDLFFWYSEELFFGANLEINRVRGKDHIDVGNDFLNDIYNYFYDFYRSDEEEYFKEIKKHKRFITLVLAYLHENHMYSRELFLKYIDDIDTFLEKLPLNSRFESDYKDLNRIEDIWIAGESPYAHRLYIDVYDNLGAALTTQKQLIK